MKILVVGSGAREHAIAWKCLQSELVDRLFCAPANAGIAQIAQPVDIAADDIEGLLAFALDYKIDLTIVGPELPLTLGIVDRFEKEGLVILGPRKDAALIESSKIFAKNLLQTYGMPHVTAPYRVFANPDSAKKYIRWHFDVHWYYDEFGGLPLVIKANGLAAGKGVVVAKTKDAAVEAVDKFMEKECHPLILIEDYLEGWECSFTVLTDGWNVLMFPVSRDYKQDLFGNNTGGVGSFTPVVRLSNQHYREIYGYIRRVLDALRDMGRPFKGFLYPGVIITKDGPKFLEFNCRLGDPEAQVVLPRLESDFVELCYAAAIGNQNEAKNIQFNDDAFVNVVIAAFGYPGEYEKWLRIYGLEEAMGQVGVMVFHGGTRLNKSGNLVTYGGRVLSMVGRGKTVEEAREIAYKAARHISFGSKNPKKGKQWYREDIALNT